MRVTSHACKLHSVLPRVESAPLTKWVNSCTPQPFPFAIMLMQMHTCVPRQATRIYVSSSETVLKRKLMWVVSDFWAHGVAMLLFAGWLVWRCVVLHHMGSIYLFISTQVHLVFFKGAIILNANSALQWLSSKYNSNYCESQGKMLGVECSFQWQNKRHHLSSGGVKPLGWKCSAVYNCVCMHIPREKCINRWTHTLLTNRDTDLGGEGTFSQNICDYCPEGHAFRKKVCSIQFHETHRAL